MNHSPFFMDLGQDVTLRRPDGSEQPLERYAIWEWDPGKRKHQVKEVAFTLEELKAKYGDLPVHVLPPPREPD